MTGIEGFKYIKPVTVVANNNTIVIIPKPPPLGEYVNEPPYHCEFTKSTSVDFNMNILTCTGQNKFNPSRKVEAWF